MLGWNTGPLVEHFLCHYALNIEILSRIYCPHTYMNEPGAHFQQIAECIMKIRSWYVRKEKYYPSRCNRRSARVAS